MMDLLPDWLTGKRPPEKKRGTQQVTLSSGATPVTLTKETQWAAGGQIIAETTEESLEAARLRNLEATKLTRQRELLKKK